MKISSGKSYFLISRNDKWTASIEIKVITFHGIIIDSKLTFEDHIGDAGQKFDKLARISSYTFLIRKKTAMGVFVIFQIGDW